MSSRQPVVLAPIVALLLVAPAWAWNSKVHMAIAYIAYQKLSRNVRDRADEILVFNPLYKQWTQGVKLGQRGLVAFMYAAVWPELIQDPSRCPGYLADGPNDGNSPPNSQEAWQNIGYADKSMHKYWHFVHTPYTTGDIKPEDAQKPNAETQLVLFTEAISYNTADAIKSYDVAWIAHLIGDIHQPLHCIDRFTINHPRGDCGGNGLHFCAPPCQENLHAYWDNLLGTEDDVESAIRLGKSLAKVPPFNGPESVDIPQWVSESFELAKRSVYVAPVGGDNNPSETISPRPDDAYRAAALKLATFQVIQAGNRLAELLNNNLK
jgi:S1/P1 Nuclease